MKSLIISERLIKADIFYEGVPYVLYHFQKEFNFILSKIICSGFAVNMSHAVVNPDREELIQCPYDPVHMISQMRFPYHLIKCRKNHNGKEYAQCPFDAKHVILKTRFQDHLEKCDKRAIIEPQLVMDDTRNLELLIPESQADKIQALLTNEWDLEMPSATASNGFVTQTVHNTFQVLGSGGGIKPNEVNSFSSGARTGKISDNGHFIENKTSSWNGGINSHGDEFHNYDQYGGTSFSNASYDYYQDKPEYSDEAVPVPRKPYSMGKGKNNQLGSSGTLNSTVNDGSAGSCDAETAYSVPPRRPYSMSSKSTINSPDPQKPGPAKSYGRGRAALRRGTEDVHVVNKDVGPGSYVIQSLPEQIDSYDPPSATSFGRGRGAANYSDKPTMRRPGMSESGTKASLEKEKHKLLKKIRETKVLEERLANGEVLEDNQVCYNSFIF
jgi:hypothetical protein